MNLYSLMILILAYLIASLLNVIIYRLPLMLEDHKHPLNLFLPASHCPACKSKIRYWHNIPIIGFLWLRGCCKDCQTKIPKRYLLVEMIYPLMVLVFALINQNNLMLTLFSWFWGLLLVLSVIDLEKMILPDPLNYLLIWSGLLINLHHIFCPIDEAIYGAAFGYLSLWAFYHGFRLLTGKEGFGYGDFKLFAGLGSWFGIYALFPLLMIACLLGIGLYLLLAIKQGKQSLLQAKPFGPMLAASGIIYFFSFTLGRPWFGI